MAWRIIHRLLHWPSCGRLDNFARICEDTIACIKNSREIAVEGVSYVVLPIIYLIYSYGSVPTCRVHARAHTHTLTTIISHIRSMQLWMQLTKHPKFLAIRFIPTCQGMQHLIQRGKRVVLRVTLLLFPHSVAQ